MTDKPKTKKPAAPKPNGMRTPFEWMLATGNWQAAPTTSYGHEGEKRGPAKLPNWQHAVASELHGWHADTVHEHNPAKSFRLSEADYVMAIKAAETAPHKQHAAAVSLHCNPAHANHGAK